MAQSSLYATTGADLQHFSMRSRLLSSLGTAHDASSMGIWYCSGVLHMAVLEGATLEEVIVDEAIVDDMVGEGDSR